MTEAKAASADTSKAAAKPAATKSAAEGENLPSASAAAVASEAAAAADPNTVTATEIQEIVKDDGSFGPFQDTAKPVGAALEAATAPKEIDESLDFEDDKAFTENVGDVFVAVRTHNQRNVVEVGIAGWNGPGFVFAPYQAKLLHKALGNVVKKLKSKK